MSTLILSDLHLGSLSNSDLLRRAELRATLLEAVADVERVVLLGDVLELRQGPMRDAMAAARPFFEDLGRALAGRELVITAGNHDHALVEPWLARRGEVVTPAPLEQQQLLTPEEASPALARIAEWASPARVRVAYPGLWVRPDVYATHGHYLDCHLTVPTLERLSIGAMSRLVGRSPETFDSVPDYEALVAPLFAWRDVVARDARTGAALNGAATVNVWHALRSRDTGDVDTVTARRSPLGVADRLVGYASLQQRRWALYRLRRAAFAGAFPLAVSVLNHAGIGPLKPSISTGELRRAGLAAMGEVAARIGLGDAYVIFGHTHRAGPRAGDDRQEWLGRSGARLVNTGSWTYASIFLTAKPGESPYWPGGCVLVEDTGAPVQLSLLADRALLDIAPRFEQPAAAPDLA